VSAVAVRWTPRSMSEVMAYRGEAFLAGYAESPGVPVHEAGHRFEGLEQFLFVCAAAPGTHTPSGVVAPAREGYLATRRAAERVLGPLDETLWPPGADGASRDESGNDG